MTEYATRNSILVCNQTLSSTQPSTLSGMGNEYQPRSSALRPGR